MYDGGKMKAYLLKRSIIPVLIFFACYWIDGSFAMLFAFFFVCYGVFVGKRKSRLNEPNSTNELYINQVLNTKDKAELPEFCLLLKSGVQNNLYEYLFYSSFALFATFLIAIDFLWSADYWGAFSFGLMCYMVYLSFNTYCQQYNSLQSINDDKTPFFEITHSHFNCYSNGQYTSLEWKDIKYFELYSDNQTSPLEFRIFLHNNNFISFHSFQLPIDIYQFEKALNHYHSLIKTIIQSYS